MKVGIRDVLVLLLFLCFIFPHLLFASTPFSEGSPYWCIEKEITLARTELEKYLMVVQDFREKDDESRVHGQPQKNHSIEFRAIYLDCLGKIRKSVNRVKFLISQLPSEIRLQARNTAQRAAETILAVLVLYHNGKKLLKSGQIRSIIDLERQIGKMTDEIQGKMSEYFSIETH